jgi:hypothetical protein
MARRRSTRGRSGTAQPAGPRELIVVSKAGAELRVTPDGVASAEADVRSLARLIRPQSVSFRPLFGLSEDRLQAQAEALAGEGAETPNLSVYYQVEAPDERLDDLAEELCAEEVVETAYVKPPGEPPDLNDMAPAAEEPPAATPDFAPRQGYLEAAPGGVDARYAWTQPGGGGAGVRIIDLEWSWRFSHEDLLQNQGGVVGGTAGGSANHGTAVIGEISGDRNAFGVTGICPDASISAVAFSMPTASAIRLAADRLRPGDVMLLEIHRAGPRHGFQARQDQRGYVAIEWWPDDYDAIRYAVGKGVIVVEAAGNGAENLDDALYDTNPAAPYGPFPSWWRNPYRRDPLDSGAIVVGAGAPPPGTHGRNHGADRSRLDFSNYGALVDTQGWGREVTSCGYGDLQGGTNEDLWYTDRFSGTSSASPIVVGTLGSVQGALRAAGRIPWSPARAREELRATGSPQQATTGRPVSQRIGNRPNLRELIPRALQTGAWTGTQFAGTLAPSQTRCWFTHSWPAHWHVVWTVVPTTPRPGAPQVRWKVRTERASDGRITYWICITNLTTSQVGVEARYAVLGW